MLQTWIPPFHNEQQSFSHWITTKGDVALGAEGKRMKVESEKDRASMCGRPSISQAGKEGIDH
jgi:hypothetical protein